MRSTRIWTGVFLALYLAAAAAVYVPLFHTGKVETARMARLVVSKPPAGFTNPPAASNAGKPSSSPFAEVKADSKRSGDSTGTYSIEWTSPSSSSNAVSMTVSVLPSPADALKVQDEATTSYLSSGALKAQSYSYVGPVAAPSIPGSAGALFKSSTSANPPLVAIGFPLGRAQVMLFVGTSATPSVVERTATSFAGAEYDHLRSAIPAFSLVRWTWPLLGSLIYWASIGIIAFAVIATPVIRRRARERRRLVAERARAQQKTVRGSKIVKRQAGRRHH